MARKLIIQAISARGRVRDSRRRGHSLACSALTEHQAFGFGANAYGILFHPEANGEIILSMTKNFNDEAEQAGIARSRIYADTEKYLSKYKSTADKIFSGWAKPIV